MMHSRPLGLTDVQLEQLLDAAFEVAPERRTAFLNEVVAELLPSGATNVAVEKAIVKVSARMRVNGDCA
jgi:hypothetical protein